MRRFSVFFLTQIIISQTPYQRHWLQPRIQHQQHRLGLFHLKRFKKDFCLFFHSKYLLLFLLLFSFCYGSFFIYSDLQWSVSSSSTPSHLTRKNSVIQTVSQSVSHLLGRASDSVCFLPSWHAHLISVRHNQYSYLSVLPKEPASHLHPT